MHHIYNHTHCQKKYICFWLIVDILQRQLKKLVSTPPSMNKNHFEYTEIWKGWLHFRIFSLTFQPKALIILFSDLIF